MKYLSWSGSISGPVSATVFVQTHDLLHFQMIDADLLTRHLLHTVQQRNGEHLHCYIVIFSFSSKKMNYMYVHYHSATQNKGLNYKYLNNLEIYMRVITNRSVPILTKK